MGSLIGYGLLAYVLLRSIQRQRARRLLMLGTTALILTIGFSRLYLGVHYLNDVIRWVCGGLRVVRRVCVGFGNSAASAVLVTFSIAPPKPV